MISQLGQGLVLASLLVCTVGAPLAFYSGAVRSDKGLAWSRRLTLLFAGFMVLANVLMEIALITHDYSVWYVSQVGSNASPLYITIVSLWSSLEGSILFWGGILGAFVALFAILQKKGHEDYLAYSLGTLF
ncbi:MAG: heme lyase CcmF/NrfE family subunit, partial [Deltaproteobacteria bacterium]|nr:heme lyase CcmF/NrfE family subunit [Deltaproteobacteria bacterium]